ncbi:MAG: MATE family efflux transporter [Bacteroidetes bacterium CG_4_10_14_3_um_filter_42_6]|nr:MAG: MATE family efflux transporter [Bacteroidetes bacterium CG_4_10_14_3_um_filter_42_6]PJB57789.1 MAG: MATE family efflux transporter [Bacteroidetes bacterium CG_4_9_14_3_um_filter_41_19]
MKTIVSYKRIWLVAYPIILGSIAQNIIIFTDTAFLGRVGDIALGASALGGLFYLAVVMLGFGFGTGVQIIIARRLGENNLKDIGPVVIHSLLFLMMVAMAAFVLLHYGSIFILKSTVNSEAVYLSTIDFLKFRSFGIFFAFINITFRSFYVGLTRTKVITFTTIVMALVNIAFDYLFIFGHAGFPEMGIQGAALASVLAEASAMLFFVAYTHITIRYQDYNLLHFSALSFSKLRDIFHVSIPMMLQQFVSLSVWFGFFLFVEKLGEQSLAVSNIVRSIYMIIMVPVWGFSTATNSLVSYLIGMGRQNEVMPLIYKTALMCFTLILVPVGLTVVLPEAFMHIYTNDPGLISMGIPVLYVVSLGGIFVAIGFVFFSGVSGAGMTKTSLIIEMIILTFYLIYTYSMVHYFKTDVAGVWTAELVYGLLMFLISWPYMKSGRWMSAKV